MDVQGSPVGFPCRHTGHLALGVKKQLLPGSLIEHLASQLLYPLMKGLDGRASAVRIAVGSGRHALVVVLGAVACIQKGQPYAVSLSHSTVAEDSEITFVTSAALAL